MGSCFSQESTQDAQQSKNVDEFLYDSKIESLLDFKILLLGAGESGKSTVVKQLKVLHKVQMDDVELQSYAVNIHKNAVQCMQILLDAQQSLQISIEDAEAQRRAENVKSFVFSLEHKRVPPNIAEDIEFLWKDPSINKIWARRSEYWFLDATPYYIENLHRFMEDGYTPTEEDIIMTRVRTTGIATTELDEGPVHFRVVDVGGQRNERKKWIHCFDDVKALLFVVNLAGYDQVMFEDPTQNRMEESLNLFAQVSCFMVLFNKIEEYHLFGVTTIDMQQSSICIHTNIFVFEQERFKKDVKYTWDEVKNNDLINHLFDPRTEEDMNDIKTLAKPLNIGVPSVDYKKYVKERDIEMGHPITKLFVKDNKEESGNLFSQELYRLLDVKSVTAFSKMSEATVKLNWHSLLIIGIFKQVAHMFEDVRVDSSYTGGSYTGGSYTGGSYTGGSYTGGSYTGGSYTGGSYTGEEEAVTTAGQRRDLYIWLRGVLLFFGEAKRETDDLNVAVKELVTKTTDSVPTLPYIFGIAVAGEKAQFYRYKFKDSSTEVIKWGDGEDTFNYKHKPVHDIKPCILKGGSTSIEEHDDHFKKEFTVPKHHETRLRHIYKHLLLGTFANAATYKVFINDIEVNENTINKVAGQDVRFRLEVRPKGKIQMPDSPSQLFVATTNLLDYLKSLHRNSIVHRDLRWPNVVFDVTTQQYFVIDHETAANDGEKLFWTPGHPDFFDESVAARVAPYQLADDIYQLGVLIIRALNFRINRSAWTDNHIRNWLVVAEECQKTRASCNKVERVITDLATNLK